MAKIEEYFGSEEYYRGEPYKGDDYECCDDSDDEKQKYDYNDRLRILKAKNNIKLWSVAIDVRDSKDPMGELPSRGLTKDDFVLFHYTGEKAFRAITSLKSSKVLASKVPASSIFGFGIYGSRRAPHLWPSKQAVLLNNYWPAKKTWGTKTAWPAEDKLRSSKEELTEEEIDELLKTELSTKLLEGDRKGSSDYCIAVVCNRNKIKDAMHEWTSHIWMPNNEDRPPGMNQYGEAQPKWRDIWILELSKRADLWPFYMQFAVSHATQPPDLAICVLEKRLSNYSGSEKTELEAYLTKAKEGTKGWFAYMSQCGEESLLALDTAFEAFGESDELKEPLCDSLKEFKVPVIVVLGKTSVGKSTVLQRITQLPFFPSGTQICTRMPVRVELRKTAGALENDRVGTVTMTVWKYDPATETYSLSATETEPLDFRDVSAEVEKRMDELVQRAGVKVGRSKINSEMELRIRVSSPTFPVLDLIDLPGVVPGNSAAAAATAALFKRYALKEGSRSLFIYVVAANSPAIEWNTAGLLGQDDESDEQLKSLNLHTRSLGIFAKCDAMSKDDEDVLIEYLTGDPEDLEDWVKLEHGYLAVAGNADRETADEQRFFDQIFHGHNLKDRTSIKNVRRVIKNVYLHQVASEWVPIAVPKVLMFWANAIKMEESAPTTGMSRMQVCDKAIEKLVEFYRRHHDGKDLVLEEVLKNFQPAENIRLQHGSDGLCKELISKGLKVLGQTGRAETDPALQAEGVEAAANCLNSMSQSLEDKSSEIEQVKAELAALKTSSAEQQEELRQAESRYQQLLRIAVMQSSGSGAAPSAAPKRQTGKRNVFIQLVGAQGTGKTPLLESLIAEYDQQQLPKFRETKGNLMAHSQVKVNTRSMKILDCSGNHRGAHLVKEWFNRSQWVFIVYDLAKKESFDYALTLTQEAHSAGARPLLFGNRYNVDLGHPIQVDVAAAKDAAIRAEGQAMESSSLIDAVQFAISSEDAVGDSQGVEAASPDGKRSSIAKALDAVKLWSGGDRSMKAGGVLRPSLKGTKSMKQTSKDGDLNLRPIQELQDSDSAVTCICFGQERLHKAYILLACASKGGPVVVYRCYRTEMEIVDLPHDFSFDSTDPYETPPAANFAVHSRLVGHSNAITSLFFNLMEDQLVTASIDKSVRFWSVDSGEMLKVLTDSTPVGAAIFLPFNPQVFVAANSNAVLRLVQVNGMVLQKIKVESEVRALKFDDTGLFLFAGTKSSSIQVYEAVDVATLRWKFKVHVARGSVTCISFVPAAHGRSPCLLVNTSDNSATIIDCTYEKGVLTNLTVRNRTRVAHELLPLKNCHSPSGQGWMISASEDKEVHIYALGKEFKMHYLKHHQVPVVAVAVNRQDTMLASADTLGRVVLWRRLDFSHIPD